MNYSTAVILINPSIRAVRGQYEKDGSTEVFKTIDQSLQINDFAVVETSARWGFTVFKITEVDVEVDFDSTRSVGWVVQKISLPDHEKIKQMENAAIDLIKKGEIRKRREDIRKNTLDAFSAGEIDNLDIAKLGVTAIENKSRETV